LASNNQDDYTPEWDNRLGVDVVNVGEGRSEKDWGVDRTGNLV
jgi:hypothetical protein